MAAAFAMLIPASPVRFAVVGAFLLLGPGLVIVTALRLGRGATRLALAVGASIAVETIGATVMVYAKVWSPTLLLYVLIGGTVVACGLERIGTSAGQWRVAQQGHLR